MNHQSKLWHTLPAMQVLDTIRAVRDWRQTQRGPVVLVPTMGALHPGHLSLIERARDEAGNHGAVVVSIFVNPTQFGPGEDLARYPRPLEVDLARCEAAGVAMAFVPTVAEVYPPDEPDVTIDVPGVTQTLEGEHRPGHFAGVLRVVAKLFHIVMPDAAVFGLKDYQQFLAVRSMAAGLSMPVRVLGSPTVREADGLAMSSRNAYLTPQQRERARGIPLALEAARKAVVEREELDPAVVAEMMREVLVTHRLEVDYATLRDPDTLQPRDLARPGDVALIAARCDAVRLIDNARLS